MASNKVKHKDKWMLFSGTILGPLPCTCCGLFLFQVLAQETIFESLKFFNAKLLFSSLRSTVRIEPHHKKRHEEPENGVFFMFSILFEADLAYGMI